MKSAPVDALVPLVLVTGFEAFGAESMNQAKPV
jgi:hypothetical protein